jgi:hypothetical protein
MQSMQDWEKQQKEFDASLQHLKETRAGMQKKPRSPIRQRPRIRFRKNRPREQFYFQRVSIL